MKRNEKVAADFIGHMNEVGLFDLMLNYFASSHKGGTDAYVKAKQREGRMVRLGFALVPLGFLMVLATAAGAGYWSSVTLPNYVFAMGLLCFVGGWLVLLRANGIEPVRSVRQRVRFFRSYLLEAARHSHWRYAENPDLRNGDQHIGRLLWLGGILEAQAREIENWLREARKIGTADPVANRRQVAELRGTLRSIGRAMAEIERVLSRLYHQSGQSRWNSDWILPGNQGKNQYEGGAPTPARTIAPIWTPSTAPKPPAAPRQSR